jgi:hypothetical protein
MLPAYCCGNLLKLLRSSMLPEATTALLLLQQLLQLACNAQHVCQHVLSSGLPESVQDLALRDESSPGEHPRPS